MSLLAVGLNHRTAPTSLLELAAVSADETAKVLHDLVAADHISEAVVLSTCNRTEIYAEVETFHGGLADISDQLSRVCGVPLNDLANHLYVHHEARAVSHLFSVVCGLDSMLVGESQILGQVRVAFRAAQAAEVTSGILGGLFQTALRVGKRAHAETSIDAAGASIVAVGVRMAAFDLQARRPDALAAPVAGPGTGPADAVEEMLRPGLTAPAVPGGDDAPLAGARVLIIGAGAVGSLAAQTVRRAGAGEVVIANRTPAHAARVAQTHDARAVGLADVAHEIGRADLVLSSTGASGLVVGHDVVRSAMAGRGGRPLVFLDLALPRDIDPAVRELPGVTLIDIEALRVALDGAQVSHDVEAVRSLVAAEVAGFLDRRRAERVAPTVVALRAHAAAVVRDELDRLRSRMPDLDNREWDMVSGTVRRVVDKLLHAPTVRVQQLAEAPGGDSYAEALRELFDLPRDVPAIVSAPDLDLVERT
ncbi:glutamyl-tRNA reductase [Parafrankia colletiae]|uniref:Glutamyl-tRNA reductase n=1 Tax=Parafrankia colletiae TaxID=573497 RepID=A0A1S1QVM9_9ACTN|nr:glutamyl-tRNA reductase [Parafrankia colletiae]MCK9899492.1 glutamyl-tRNA reductase [Frankia sp. Cpl3]OHV38768.1 glutamyl-tRNA reductase [Parafrankia colletiae]